MKVTQTILEYKSQSEIMELVDFQSKVALMDFKENLIKEALQDSVTKYHGQIWLKVRESEPAPWICSNCGPRAILILTS